MTAAIPPHPFPPHHTVDGEALRELLHRQAPHWRHASLCYVDEGHDNQVFALDVPGDGRWAIRLPKQQRFALRQERERELLHHLAPVLPVQVPDFAFIGEPDLDYPWRFAGYRFIPGRVLATVDLDAAATAELALRLGDLLSNLHAYPLQDLDGLDVPREPQRDSWSAALIEERLQRCLPLLGEPLVQACRHWFQDFSAPVLADDDVITHNDLYAQHILLHPDRDELAAVIDWTDAVITHACVDFPGLWLWGGDTFLQQILQSYRRPVDPGLTDYCRKVGTYLALGDVSFAMRFKELDRIQPAGTAGCIRCLAEQTGVPAEPRLPIDDEGQ